ncbi:hypothetical protein COLO4_14300 [Corchorus olitorius]|uniref:DNA mismatch repair protein MSH3 n=1 Tax=Corchorus olitorius TaxID=93759 RepID=A0A1R3JSU6_9ROSI|nr:hypothetical protein COLO4_14300 [Corchorus olitorius]
MGKQKQQVISRFFAPKPKTPSAPNPLSNPCSSSSSPPPPPPISSPNVKATVSFSPLKRKLLSDHLASTSKKPKVMLSPHTHNPVPPPQSNPSLHQRFLQKLLEPSTPPLLEPSVEGLDSDRKKYTPLEQQVVDLKNKYPDVLLMVEVGYRFRFFGKDAEIAAKVLGIYAHVDRNFLTASVPTFRLNVHVRRLVNAGYKVGVVKQTETAAIKAHGSNKLGPFCRGLSALYTKATLEAAEDVGGKEEECGGESNYLVCVVDKCVENSGLVSGCGGIEVRVGVVGVEISTGDVVYGEFDDGVMRSGLEAVVLSLSPAELLLGQPLSRQTEKFLLAYAGPASNVRVEHASRDCFEGGGALAEVMSVYEKMVEDNIADNVNQLAEATEQGKFHSSVQRVMNMPDLVLEALALTIRHLKQFGFEGIICLGASFRSLSSSLEMNLSANTLQQLEIVRNNSDGSESGSLLQIMNHTLTIFGSRLLRHWVTHPLCDRNMISARLDAVSEIALSMGSYSLSQSTVEIDGEDSDATIIKTEFYSVLSSVLTFLGRSPDIQRGITRIFHRTATPAECHMVFGFLHLLIGMSLRICLNAGMFIAVIQAILSAGKQLQRLHIVEECEENGGKKVPSGLLKRLILIASSPIVLGNAAKLLSTLYKEAADKGDLTNLIIISKDQFPELAKARKAVQLARQKLDNLIGLYRKQLGKCNLEFTSVSGTTHLIELPIDAKVPSNWIKVNSTKRTIRYHPPEVLTALDQLALVNEELTVIGKAAWDSFLREFGEYYAEFQAAVQALATLDCLHSLATLSRNKNYVRPTFVDDNEPVQIEIHSGRHPVLETILQDGFVPNETTLHADREYCQIVTGPNMGGKSCYIRQVALIALMAQVGSFVPAAAAKLHVLDAIYTRMGASDSIQQGRSTFLEELSEASQILRNCTGRSLVIIDELGRGTSTHDGVAIAYATLHHLLEQKKCMVLFVTHYPKIADIKAEFPGSVEVYHVSYLTAQNEEGTLDAKSNHDVTYLYKLVPGVSARSFGFKVAQLAQLPSSCISQAIIMASRLEAIESSRVRKKSGQRQWLVASPSDQELERQENIPKSIGSFCSKNPKNSKEFASAFNDFLLNLKSAITHDDLSRSFQLLKEARSTAKQLLNGGKTVTRIQSGALRKRRMAAYLILLPAIFSCFFFALASHHQQTGDHNLLIRELHDAELKISRLESFLEETVKNINAKTLYLKEGEKLLDEMAQNITNLQSALSSLEDDSFLADGRLKSLEEEVRQLWAVSRKNNFKLHVLESKAQEAEDKLEVVTSQVEKMAEIVTEQWIQIQHLEQALQITKVASALDTNNINEDVASSKGKAYELIRDLSERHLPKMFGALDSYSFGKGSTIKYYMSQALQQVRRLWSAIKKYHHELQGFIKQEMRRTEFTAALVNDELASALITFPILSGWMLVDHNVPFKNTIVINTVSLDAI